MFNGTEQTNGKGEEMVWLCWVVVRVLLLFLSPIIKKIKKLKTG